MQCIPPSKAVLVGFSRQKFLLSVGMGSSILCIDMKRGILFASTVFSLLAILGTAASAQDTRASAEPQSAEAGKGSSKKAPKLEDYTEEIEAHLINFEMKAIPGGTVEVPDPENPGETIETEVEPFWIAATPVTWAAYGIYAFNIDEVAGDEIDAASRPTRARLGADFPLDRGWGWGNRPAIAVTHQGAEGYAEWLSDKTGREYRVPTEAEWIHACRAGGKESKLDPEELEKHAWFKANSEEMTHPVGELEPNAFGVYDMLGNVTEWVEGINGKPAVLGGSYRTPAEKLSCTYRQTESPLWQGLQFPRSPWWYTDAPFVGFRLVHRPAEKE